MKILKAMKSNLIVLLVLFLMGCGSSTTENKQTEAPQKKATPPPAKVQQKAGPTYESFYYPESVELETVSFTGEIDQETALKIVVNSHEKVKADFLNYMMEAYKTVNPTSSQIEPMFDAEHIGKFIVWQYVKEDTECYPAIFDALKTVFTNADEDAYMLAKYGIYQMMIYESKRLDVNYNGDFNPWLSGKVYAEWFELIDEMESGRS